MAESILPAMQSKSEIETLSIGIKAMQEATHFNCWRKSYTKPVNDAMDIILLRFPKLSPKIAAQAVHKALQQETA